MSLPHPHSRCISWRPRRELSRPAGDDRGELARGSHGETAEVACHGHGVVVNGATAATWPNTPDSPHTLWRPAVSCNIEAKR